MASIGKNGPDPGIFGVHMRKIMPLIGELPQRGGSERPLRQLSKSAAWKCLCAMRAYISKIPIITMPATVTPMDR